MPDGRLVALHGEMATGEIRIHLQCNHRGTGRTFYPFELLEFLGNFICGRLQNSRFLPFSEGAKRRKRDPRV